MSRRSSPSVPANAPRGESWPSIPGYELLCEIAAGGMATVYLATQTDHGEREARVAIKYCHPHLRRDPNFVSMFSDEAKLASLIHHPNVVSTLDVGSADSLYFVMQYVEGVSLADWLLCLANSGDRIPESQLLRVVLDVLAGLEAAHALTDDSGRALHLVHRDISPQNILIGLDGVSKISDFGIAKAEARATRTRTGQVKGKSGYMSPEQILLEPIDERSDLYTVGVVLWEALTNRRLFDSDSDAATINLVLRGQIPVPSSVSGSDPRLDDLVRKALSFQPADRFPTASAFAEAIRGVGVPTAEPGEVGESIETLFGEKLRNRQRCSAAIAFDGDPTLAHPRPTPSSHRKALQLRNAKWLVAPFIIGLVGGTVWIVRRCVPKDDFGASPPARAQPPGADSIAPATITSGPAVDAASPLAPSATPSQQDSSVTVPLSASRAVAPRLRSSATSRSPATTTRFTSAPAPSAAAPAPSTPPIGTPRPPRSRPSEFRPNDL